MTTYLRTNKASLYLGVLLCTGQTTDAAGNVFTIKAMADAASWGAPQPIDVAVQRWMTDGAVASTQGYENREITFVVKVSAASSVALAAGEAALVEAVRGAVVLAWVPPEGPNAAPTTVFDIWTGHLEHQLDPDAELRLTRAYQVTLTAKPWARSQDVTATTAVTTGGSVTLTSVDTCASATGWTAKINGATAAGQPTVISATALRVSESVTSAKYKAGNILELTAIRTGSVTGMGTTPYLAIDRRNSGPFSTWTVTVDGQVCGLAGTVGTVYYYRVPAGVTSFTTLAITSHLNVVSSTIGTTVTQDVYDVSKTNVVGSTTTHRMLSGHLDVGGSVKTNGSIQIASPSATVLGNTLVYSGPEGSGYSPPLRQYRTSGGTVTADATAVSGSREPLSATMIYSIPAGALRPGTYVVVARIIFTAVGSALFNFDSLVPGSTTNLLERITQTVSAGAAGVGWYVIGSIILPPVAQPGESAVATGVRILGTGLTGTAPTLDEAFLLDVTNGTFSLVTSVAPATFTRLWIDSPDATNGPPQIYFGANADRSDAVGLPYGQIISMGDHDLDPDGSMVFTVTDNVDDAVVNATYYQRWHTHAAA
jgi:hypothetical protein